MLTLLTPRYLDFESVTTFFKRIGTEGGSDNRQLAWNTSTYTKDGADAKKVIDKLFNLAKDKEVLKDIDEVLDIYFDKVFKYNKEEY